MPRNVIDFAIPIEAEDAIPMFAIAFAIAMDVVAQGTFVLESNGLVKGNGTCVVFKDSGADSVEVEFVKGVIEQDLLYKCRRLLSHWSRRCRRVQYDLGSRCHLMDE